MENLLNTEKCYYCRGNTDCSEWQADRVNAQLDYCDNCDRYTSCQNVAYLNDRLVELDNEGIKTLKETQNKELESMEKTVEDIIKEYESIRLDIMYCSARGIKPSPDMYTKRSKLREYLISKGILKEC